MLPKRRRIARHLFPNDPRVGAVFHAPHLSLRVTVRTLPVARVSIVVSKKVSAKATDRHLVKRRVYDAVSRCEKKRSIPPALYVFFAKSDAHTVPFSQLMTETQTLLHKASDAIVKTPHVV